MARHPLRRLPSVDRILKTPKAVELSETYGRIPVVHAARAVLQALRAEILESKGDSPASESGMESVVLQRMEHHLERALQPSLRRAINATGVILHTGLGRAVLPEDAEKAVSDVIRGSCTLAIDQETGRRGHRDTHLEKRLCELTGAEAATVVNNNAAATMLILNTLARGKEVIVSRGQLVEIGGSFRMPDVMAASGAILKEVGTTNKTHLEDYEEALSENTGAILRVHHSNYRILGFAEEPSIEDLAGLARKHGVPLVDDLGSGALLDLSPYGIEPEPLVQMSLEAGADVVCFSGDKLIGGPQSGIIVGRAELVQTMRKNPLARAFRVGKMTIAAMEATLRLFLDPDMLAKKHPVYRMLSARPEALEARARKVLEALKAQRPHAAEYTIQEGQSQVGSGSAPVESLPTRVLAVRPRDGSAEALARRLRLHTPPIFPRVQRDAVLLDFRTIQEDEDPLLLEALVETLESPE